MFKYITVNYNDAESVAIYEKRKEKLESQGWTLVSKSGDSDSALLSYANDPIFSIDPINESA